MYLFPAEASGGISMVKSLIAPYVDGFAIERTHHLSNDKYI
ncbi:hypothetical protein AB6E04_08030 [Vibrio amylolyticus]